MQQATQDEPRLEHSQCGTGASTGTGSTTSRLERTRTREHNRASDARTSVIAPALTGWIAGTALHLQLPVLPPATVHCAVLAAAVLIAITAIKWRASTARVTLVFITQLALAFAICGLRAQHFASHALNPALEGRDIQIEGTVAAMPQRNELGVRFRFDVDHAVMDSAAVELPPRISLGWWSDGDAALPAVTAGDRWRFTVRLKAPHGSMNPHGFDFELWMWEQGLQATGSVRAKAGNGAPLRVAQSWSRPVERVRQAVRDDILLRVENRPAAGVVAALVTGDQNAIGRSDWDIFRATGVAHLMSISGLHVTMFAWLAAALAGIAWRRSLRLCLMCPAPTASVLMGVLLAFGYALFSGWGVPSQRTVLMLATIALLQCGARRWPWPHVWLLACAVVLASDPWAMLQAGFWLSFVAVGVLFATDLGQRGSESSSESRSDASSGSVSLSLKARTAHALKAFLALLREQWIVTFALAPLTVLLFQQVSLIGLLANLIAIPWVTLVVTPLAMLGVALPWLWHLAALAVQVLGGLLEWLAALPFATLSMAAPPLWMGIASIVGAALLVMRLPVHLRAWGLPLLLPALMWQPLRPAPGEFSLLAADIGQGNAVLVRTATHALLYDTGPRYTPDADAGDRVLVPLLRAMGEQLDLLVLSHRDSDHTGGAAAVLAAQPSAGLLASLEDSHPLRLLRPTTQCAAGQAWTWDGVMFEVLHPPAKAGATAGLEPKLHVKPNTVSCVVRITSASGASALLAGDIERVQEAALVDARANLGVDVLLVPHHGSKTSSSDRFLGMVRPKIALVQAGYRNRFGHPADEVVARYAARSIAVVDSATCGAAHWASDEPARWRCERNEGRRYWHHLQPR